MKTLLATMLAAALLALAPMMTATGFQSFQTFANAQVSIPFGTNANGAAKLFCSQRGYTNASAYDLNRLYQGTGGAQGMAFFENVTCRSYMPVTTSGGLLP
jgi:hypothetical protein